MIRRMVLNETSYFGPGARSALAGELVSRGYQKALVVTDPDLLRVGVAGKVTAVLDENSFPYEVYSDVKANPTVGNVQRGVDVFHACGADCIVAVGGGSVIDTAKGIGIIAVNPERYDVCSLEGATVTRNRCVPLFALPTTSGTAAEVTINYVITDTKNIKKMVCVDPHDIPVVAIIDAELMMGMPRGLCAATGMDALTHAIEGFITKGAWEMTDMVELRAIELIHQTLYNSVEGVPEAREGMALAQYIAGMGFSNVGLGIVHSMAHPLGAFYDIAHGVANALLLPYVMEFNKPAAAGKYVMIAKAMGIDAAGMDQDQAADAAIGAVRQLAVSIGIPQHLKELGVKQEDLPALAQAAFQDVCTGGNPREVSPEEILTLYQKAY